MVTYFYLLREQYEAVWILRKVSWLSHTNPQGCQSYFDLSRHKQVKQPEKKKEKIIVSEIHLK